ncbi:MliC family protein [Gilvimarinus japonicus]|uniref:MliC family protein n=1 Tax=Gilvimarinus japonicus TaxID=1796469 RepID=A0ABV7HPG5_9GAMM
MKPSLLQLWRANRLSVALRVTFYPILLCTVLLAGCADDDTEATIQQGANNKAAASAPAASGAGNAAGDTGAKQYNAESWKTLISASCKHFFDGCNTCTRAPDAQMAACTRKACMRYEQPRCLDNEQAAAQSSGVGKKVEYACEGDERFTVFFGEYRAGDQRVKLDTETVMLSDEQTRTTSQLKRERTASGAKYSNDSLQYWSKGSKATLHKIENGSEVELYQGCEEQGS